MKKLLNRKFLVIFLIVCMVAVLTACTPSQKDTGYLVLDTSLIEREIIQFGEFDFSLIKIYLQKETKREEIPVSEVVFDGYDTSVAGQQNVCVSYGDYKGYFSVKVYSSAAKIVLDTSLLKTTVEPNEYVDLSQLTVTFFESAEAEGEIIFLDNPLLSIGSVDTKEEGVKSVTVTYKKYFTASFDVTVKVRDVLAEYLAMVKNHLESTLMEKIGNRDYRYGYLQQDYQNSFAVLYDETVAKLTADKTEEEIKVIFEEFKTELDKCIKNTKTAKERVQEYKRSLNFSKLSRENKTKVEEIFASALEEMDNFDGGAPTLDYIFYQLKLQVSFYFA